MHNFNGWQRIGIILSALWCLFIIGLGAVAYLDRYQDEISMKECRESIKMPTNSDEKILSQILGCDRPLKRVPSILELLAIVTLPVIGAWLFVYTVIWVVKWVIAGFKSRKDHV